VKDFEIASFRDDPSIVEGLGAIVATKWRDQVGIHDANLVKLFSPSSENAPVPTVRYRNNYFLGFVGTLAAIPQERLRADNFSDTIEVAQPTGLLTVGKETWIAAGNVILRVGTMLEVVKPVISHDLFARLHTLAKTVDGKIATVSSAYDTICIVDPLKGELSSTTCFWEYDSFRTNKKGQSFRLIDGGADNASTVIDPEIGLLQADEYPYPKKFVIRDFAKYNYRGLPTSITPNMLNSISITPDGDFLLTAFNTGACILLRDGIPKTVAKGFRYPHGFMVDDAQAKYRVTDTGREQVCFMDTNFNITATASFSGISGRKPTLEKVRWLQNTSYFGNGIYCSVLQPHCKLIFFSLYNCTKHEISFNPDWGIQEVQPYNERHDD
jgi:hypothetical protein